MPALLREVAVTAAAAADTETSTQDPPGLINRRNRRPPWACIRTRTRRISVRLCVALVRALRSVLGFGARAHLKKASPLEVGSIGDAVVWVAEPAVFFQHWGCAWARRAEHPLTGPLTTPDVQERVT